MTGWLTTVVEADGTHVATLDCAPGGSVSMGLPEGTASPNRISLSIYGELPDMRGRFLLDRWHGDSGPGEWWLLLPDAPETLGEADYAMGLSGIDVTGLLTRTKLPREEVCIAGRDVAEWTDHMLSTYAPTHRARFHVRDVDTTLRSEQAFGAGASLMEAIAKPLEAAAMTAWTPLPGGLAESSAWLPAAQRPTVRGFGDDTAPDASPFYDGWDRDCQLATPAANEVLAIVRASGSLPEIVGRWADEADILKHGATTELVPGPVEAADQAAADLIAARWAEDHVRPRTEIRFTAPWQPIRPGQVAPVSFARWGIRGDFELIRKETQRLLDAPTTYTMRSV